MNFFDKVTLDRPCDRRLVIYRQPGLMFWLFILAYFGLVAGFNAIFIAMFLEALSPQTLICRSQR